MKNTDRVVDLIKYKEERSKELKRREDIKIFEKLITKPVNDLNLDELNIYKEIQPLCSFIYKDEYKLIIAEFREILFIINYLGNSTFEYLDTIDDILDVYINSLK